MNPQDALNLTHEARIALLTELRDSADTLARQASTRARFWQRLNLAVCIPLTLVVILDILVGAFDLGWIPFYVAALPYLVTVVPMLRNSRHSRKAMRLSLNIHLVMLDETLDQVDAYMAAKPTATPEGEDR